jgi:hypothetical protein
MKTKKEEIKSLLEDIKKIEEIDSDLNFSDKEFIIR